MKRKRPVGRPKSKDTMKAAVTVKLSAVDMGELKLHALKLGVSVSYLARSVLREWMHSSR